MKSPVHSLVRFALLLTVFTALPATVAHAQAATVTATWGQPEPAATANTFTYLLQRNATPQIQLTAVTCTTSGTGSSCIGTGTYTGVTIVSGDSFTLQTKAPNGLLSPQSLPTVVAGPGRPTTVTITIVVNGP